MVSIGQYSKVQQLAWVVCVYPCKQSCHLCEIRAGVACSEKLHSRSRGHMLSLDVLRIGRANMNENVIKAYTNANWAPDPNTNQKSTSGLVVKVFGSIVTWNSHIQKCVTSSEVKAEYIAGLAATREVLFYRHLLCSLGFGDHTPVVFTNNTGCIQVANDPAMHTKLKHINTKYHLI